MTQQELYKHIQTYADVLPESLIAYAISLLESIETDAERNELRTVLREEAESFSTFHTRYSAYQKEALETLQKLSKDQVELHKKQTNKQSEQNLEALEQQLSSDSA